MALRTSGLSNGSRFWFRREVVVIAARHALEDHTVVAFELGQALRRNAVDPVDLAGLQVRQLHRRIGDLDEPDAIQVWQTFVGSPIVGVGLEHDASIRRRRDEAERTGADGISVDRPVFDDLLRDDCHALECPDVHQQVRRGTSQVDLNGCIVHRFDGLHRGEPEGVGSAHFGIEDPVVGVDDVIGGECSAVVEDDIVTQRERPREIVVRDLPALRKGRLHGEVGARLHERVVDVLEHLEAGVRRGQVRVETIGLCALGGDEHRFARFCAGRLGWVVRSGGRGRVAVCRRGGRGGDCVVHLHRVATVASRCDQCEHGEDRQHSPEAFSFGWSHGVPFSFRF